LPNQSLDGCHEGSVTTGTFKQFLERLMAGATQPVFVVVDRRWQKSDNFFSCAEGQFHREHGILFNFISLTQ